MGADRLQVVHGEEPSEDIVDTEIEDGAERDGGLQPGGRHLRFPLFCDIERASCLVVGAGNVGVRRACVLASFGARVTVVDPGLSPEKAAELEREGCALQRRAWDLGGESECLLDGVRLAVASTDSRAVNADIARACMQRGIPASVADSAEESTFFFPAICRGERLVAGVVSDGAAHGLTAKAARAIRATLTEVEHSSESAEASVAVGEPGRLGAAAGASIGEGAQDGAQPNRHVGRVALVGAGPGAEDLITVRGMRLLEEADVVVFDRLVDTALLKYAGTRSATGSVRLIDVGKTSGEHPVPQREIEEILVREAHCARLVVRLKGGDPYVFGRGGEEMSRLIEAGIPCEIVPGVTSALAAPASVGIPATDRRASASVSIHTGHRRGDGGLGIDYEAIVHLGGTHVFLMSVASCGDITRGLLAAGMSPDMPACMVERGTLPGRRRVDATVATLADRAAAAHVQSPAMLVVGEVCRFAPVFAGEFC